MPIPRIMKLLIPVGCLFPPGKGNVNNKLRPERFPPTCFRTGVRFPSPPPRKAAARRSFLVEEEEESDDSIQSAGGRLAAGARPGGTTVFAQQKRKRFPSPPPRRRKLHIACGDFLCLWQKSHRALIPLLLLSEMERAYDGFVALPPRFGSAPAARGYLFFQITAPA